MDIYQKTKKCLYKVIEMKKRKIGIVMMTYFSGRSFKASQMPEIIHELSKGDQLGESYGLPYKLDKTEYSSEELKFLKRSWLCRICFAFLSKLSKHFVKIPYVYQKYEVIYGFFAKLHYNKKNVPDIVVMKPRPAFLVEHLKKLGAIVIIEASENHTRFTCEAVKKELTAINAKISDSSYVYEKAIADYEKGINLADGLICLSNFSRKTYVDRGFCERKIEVLPLSLDEEIVKPVEMEGELCFVTVAMHSVLKGTHRLIKVWKDYHVKSKLVIVGTIDADLRSIIEKLGPVENVEYWGYKNYDFMKTFYSTHRAVSVLLSFSESFGRSIYEAMCTSTPVIVTPYCTLDMVSDGKNGRIVDPKNEKEIFEAVSMFENLNSNQFFEIQKNVYQTLNEQKIEFGKLYLEKIGRLADTY